MAAKLLWASHVRQGIATLQLASMLAMYYLSRAVHGLQSFDAGTYPRAMFQVLNRFGFCPEEVWPYVIANFAQMPPTRAFQLSFDQRKPTKYYRVHETGSARVDVVKQLLAAGFPVGIGAPVSHEFVRGAKSFVWGPPAGNIAGGHAMVLGGYNEQDEFDLLSSWGRHWSDDGWTKVTADYVAWSETRSTWVVEHAPPYSEAA
jgi:hypothetical protein